MDQYLREFFKNSNFKNSILAIYCNEDSLSNLLPLKYILNESGNHVHFVIVD